MTVEITFSKASVYSLAAQHNARLLFANLRISYRNEEDAQQQVLRNITVELRVESNLLEPQTWEIAQLSPGESTKLQERPLKFANDYLFELTDPTKLNFTFTVKDQEDGGETFLVKTEIIEVLPANVWEKVESLNY